MTALIIQLFVELGLLILLTSQHWIFFMGNCKGHCVPGCSNSAGIYVATCYVCCHGFTTNWMIKISHSSNSCDSALTSVASTLSTFVISFIGSKYQVIHSGRYFLCVTFVAYCCIVIIRMVKEMWFELIAF
jgi:hypothetical protein